jgi:IS30 family transposase
MSSRYTEEEDTLLAELFEKQLTKKAIAERIGRPYSSIEARMRRLGLVGMDWEDKSMMPVGEWPRWIKFEDIGQ